MNTSDFSRIMKSVLTACSEQILDEIIDATTSVIVDVDINEGSNKPTVSDYIKGIPRLSHTFNSVPARYAKIA